MPLTEVAGQALPTTGRIHLPRGGASQLSHTAGFILKMPPGVRRFLGKHIRSAQGLKTSAKAKMATIKRVWDNSTKGNLLHLCLFD
jgi:hypothetical protein